MDFYSIKMLIKKNLSIRFFYFDIYLAQEQNKTFKLYSNEVHGFKRSLIALKGCLNPWTSLEKSLKVLTSSWAKYMSK